MRLARVLAVAGALTLALASEADATWSNSPTLSNPVVTLSSYQSGAQIVSDGAGGAIISWSDYRATNYDIYVQHLDANGTPTWATNGLQLTSLGADQLNPMMVADGSGGAIIVWSDYRNSATTDLYAQRINSTGAPQWAANGVPVCVAANQQDQVSIVTDGNAGAYITWRDARNASTDIYLQHVVFDGSRALTTDGIALCNDASIQQFPVSVADGAGGVIVAWADQRAGNFDIYAQRYNGSLYWTVNGAVVASGAGDQTSAAIASDGANGAVIAWSDTRAGNTDIYAQRMLAPGFAGWTANGVALCTNAVGQTTPVIVSDGSGGAVVGWTDFRNAGIPDVYARRVDNGGTALWTADGVAVCIAAGSQTNLSMLPDGSGGAFFVWSDPRLGGSFDLYTQHMNASGTALWTANGAPLCTAGFDQTLPSITSDITGYGFLATWGDQRNGNTADIYAARMDRYGYLGQPEPAMAGVKDVPNDQGGHVKVSWNASYVDGDPYNQSGTYYVFRSIGTTLAAQRVAGGARQVKDGAAAALDPAHSIVELPFAGQSYAWELIGSASSFALPAYSFYASTGEDSTGARNARTAFMVQARFGTSTWNSAPDSGYSVDNLAPAPPAPFTGQYAAGTAQLHWNRNTESDLAGYRLYRGASAGFAPDPSNLVAALADTGYSDAAGQPYVYKLTAIDSHGNESLVSVVTPSGTADTPARAAAEFGLAQPSPSPAAGPTALRFTLAREASTRLTAFDAGGRRVRTISDGVRAAGEYTLRFDLADDAGSPLPAGLYFLVLNSGGRTASRKLLVVR